MWDGNYRVTRNKLRTYWSILTRKNPSRKSLVKLRISSHKLRIETGRYDKVPRDERLCSLCNCNKIEDETYFLLDFPSYSSIRDRFFSLTSVGLNTSHVTHNFLHLSEFRRLRLQEVKLGKILYGHRLLVG